MAVFSSRRIHPYCSSKSQAQPTKERVRRLLAPPFPHKSQPRHQNTGSSNKRSCVLCMIPQTLLRSLAMSLRFSTWHQPASLWPPESLRESGSSSWCGPRAHPLPASVTARVGDMVESIAGIDVRVQTNADVLVGASAGSDDWERKKREPAQHSTTTATTVSDTGQDIQAGQSPTISPQTINHNCRT